jgi:alpha-amylase
LHDPYFKISLDVYQLVDRVDIAFGETKSLVVWSGGYLDSEDQEILGSFLKLEAQAPLIYTLTTSVNPPGAGIVTLNPPSGTYNAGTAVTLTATPNSGYTFSSWSGDLTGSTNPAQITMDGNKTVTAVFLLIKAEEDNPGITYTGTWNTYTSPSCSGGAMKYSGQEGAKAEFSFTGTGIKWIVTKATMMGKAKVYLDGGYMGLVDLYSSSPAFQVVLQKPGLAPGNHTLRLEVSGQKNLRATGYYINIDAFEVIP